VQLLNAPLTNPSIAAALYTTGVTGSFTSTLVFDTTDAAPGVYYLGSSGVEMYNPSVLMIQVQAPAPATLTLPVLEWGVSYIVTYGDTLVVPMPSASYWYGNHIYIYCDPLTDTSLNSAQQFLAISGSQSVTWDTTNLQRGVLCYNWIDMWDSPYATNYFFFTERAQIPSVQACVTCGLGSYSAAPSQPCAECPAGAYGNRTGASACDACPANTASPAAATAITQCAANAGFYARYTRTIRATVTVPEAQYDAAAFLAQLQAAAGPGATVTIG
jgi:hypothetical protein